MQVVIGPGSETEKTYELSKEDEGYFTAELTNLSVGDYYYFYADGRGPFPDPASRYQPQGVHGPSAIVDPSAYEWYDSAWTGIALDAAVVYELHLGTFTPEGTFQGAIEKLEYLRELGITAVELMPLADFTGSRNWGYDGVSPFAPARCYGAPDDLRKFVDHAHQLGLAVFIDVVYNHLGPDGAYPGAFSTHYYTSRHQTPWGDGINFDGHLSEPVRRYFIENARRWVHEYHFDGLRLDATHAILDDSPRHILAELTAAAGESAQELGRQIEVVAEDARNLAKIVKPEAEGGYGLAGVWADDFHHQMRRGLAGDQDGYFADFDGLTLSIAETARGGWLKGSDATGVPYCRFVYCIQNHDQVGNRAFGDRLHHKIDEATYRAASALLLLLPQTPLLFMGQEWAASTPFRYFTDHNPVLGALVTEGRRKEFGAFSAFADIVIPDPQAEESFVASRLKWDEIAQEPHASMLRFYKSLLTLRREEASLHPSGAVPALQIEALNGDTLRLQRGSLLALIHLRGECEVELSSAVSKDSVWNSEDPLFTADSQPIEVNTNDARVRFSRPGAIVFRLADKRNV